MNFVPPTPPPPSPVNGPPTSPKHLAIIGGALVIGSLLFATIAAALPFIGSSGGAPSDTAPPDDAFVRTLSIVFAVLLVNAFVVATFLPPRIASRGGEHARATAHILRWAILEGAALFGCVVVLMAGTNGVLPAEPVYYANLAGVLVLAFVVWIDLGRLSDQARVA